MIKQLLPLAALLLLFPTSGMAQQPERIGDFLYAYRVDDFTDEERSVIMVMDDDREGSLGWGCNASGLYLGLNLGDYMRSNGSNVLVRFRFDRDEASDFQSWRIVFEGSVAHIPLDKIDEFTRSAMPANQVIMEAADPSDGERRRYSFSLRGLISSLSKLPCAKRFFE